MCSDHAALTFHCCALAHASANAFNSENRSSGCVEGSSPSHPLSPFTAALARSRFLDRNAVHRAAYTSHLLTACVWLAAHWDASHSDTTSGSSQAESVTQPLRCRRHEGTHPRLEWRTRVSLHKSAALGKASLERTYEQQHRVSSWQCSSKYGHLRLCSIANAGRQRAVRSSQSEVER